MVHILRQISLSLLAKRILRSLHRPALLIASRWLAGRSQRICDILLTQRLLVSLGLLLLTEYRLVGLLAQTLLLLLCTGIRAQL